MKTIFLTMAAAICVATPAAAQTWQGNQQSVELQTQIDAGVRSGSISQRELPALRTSLRQLSMLERQLAVGGLTGRENATLRQHGNTLRQQIHFASQTRGGAGRFDNDGRFGSQDRAGWDARYDSENRAAWDARYMSDRNSAWERARQGGLRSDNRFDMDRGDRFDMDNRGSSRFAASTRGARFAGDVGIGQRASRRMVALPDQYRGEFRDSDDVYYRYDSERVYEIDRSSNLIVRLFDLID
jgi:hypothetical protein